jgi:hypothetical protein
MQERLQIQFERAAGIFRHSSTAADAKAVAENGIKSYDLRVRGYIAVVTRADDPADYPETALGFRLGQINSLSHAGAKVHWWVSGAGHINKAKFRLSSSNNSQ